MKNFRITLKNIREFKGTLDIQAGSLPFEIWQIFDQRVFEALGGNGHLVPISTVVSTKNQLLDPKFVAGKKQDPRQNAFDKMIIKKYSDIKLHLHNL